MDTIWQQLTDKKAILTIMIGLLSAICVLVITFNVLAAILVFLYSIVSIVFRSSYSLGWLLLLGAFLLFPTLRVSEQGMILSDLLLAALALIGLINLATSHFNYPENNLFNEFFLLSLTGLAFLSIGYMTNSGYTNYDIWRLTLTLLLIWITLVSFQYYFQTLRRIKRFFILIFAIGTIHALFGLTMLAGNWQTSSGMGISNLKSYNLIFGHVTHPINGFLGLGLEERTKTNPLSPLLSISILSGVGFLLIEKKKRNQSFVEEVDFWNESLQTNQTQTNSLFDIQTPSKKKTSNVLLNNSWLAKVNERKNQLLKNVSLKQLLIIAAIATQFVALIFTFSQPSVIFLAIALLIFGILDRNKQLIISSATLMVLFSLVIPSLITSKAVNAPQYLAGLFSGIKLILPNWFLGASWKAPAQMAALANETISNNYLNVWNNFGIIGLGIFLAMLVKYFNNVYQGYRRSDGIKRVWLMVIIASYVSLTLQALIGNSLFYGPAALLFWLLYAAAMNLRRKAVIHGITETKLLNQ